MAYNTSNLTSVFWYEFIEKVEYLREPQYRYWLYLVIRSLVVALGLLGNTLSVLVLLRKPLRAKSFTVYLLALAISDTGALLARLLMWINVLRVKLGHPVLVVMDSSPKCAVAEYFFTCIHVICGWLIVAVAGERAFVLTYPLRAKLLVTPSSAKRTVLVIVFSTFAIFSYILALTIHNHDIGCSMTVRWKHFHYYISTTFVTGLPFILIASINIWIIYQLRRSGDKFGSAEKHAQQSEKRVSQMLLTITVTFFILLVPNALFVLISGVLPGWHPPALIADIANLSFDLNYAINFYLYVLTGKQIRDEFRVMMKRGNGQ